MNDQRKRLAFALAALLITTFASVATLLARGPSCGHDFNFHLVSWMEVARTWHSGVAYPHWASSANFGAGEPRFVFYPPASWMLGAALGAIFSWPATPALFTGVCLLASGTAMLYFARNFLPLAPATAAACLYIANPYMLFVAYERTAYAELMAAALVPLLLAFSTRARPHIPALAGVVAGIWLVNAPAGVIACYTLLWIALMQFALRRDWHAPLRIAAATALGLALAAFYLVPAAHQQGWVEIARAIGPGMRVADSFLFHHTGDAFHDDVLHTASLIACLLLSAAAVCFARWRDAWRDRELRALATLVPLILLLLLPLSTLVWLHAPHLQYVQFSWRWLLMLAPVAALFVVGGLARRASLRWMLIRVALLCALSITLCSRTFYQYCDEDDAVPAQVELMHDESGQEGTDEYTPRDDDNAEVEQDLPIARVLTTADAEEPDSSKQVNPEWKADPRVERHAYVKAEHWFADKRSIVIDTPVAGYAVIKLMDYPSWMVRLNGTLISVRHRRDDGLMTIPVPPGRSEIELEWHITSDVWLGRGLSLVALLCLLAIVLYERRRAIVRP